MKLGGAAFLGALVVATLAGCAGTPRPNDADLNWARTRQLRVDGGMTHCNRFRDLACRRIAGARPTYRCQYSEYAAKGPWPAKVAVITFKDDQWRWVSGDPPTCSVMLLE